MKRKIISIIIAAVMSLSFAACGAQQSQAPTETPSPITTQAPTTTPTAAPTTTPTEEPTPEPTEEMIPKSEYDALAEEYDELEEEYESYRDRTYEVNYIGNARTKKFHRPSCSYLPASHNQVPYETREEAISDGMVPCKRCSP